MPDQTVHEVVRATERPFDFGPGYRIYYTECDGKIIILLAGGDKSTQERDIEKAKKLAQNLEVSK